MNIYEALENIPNRNKREYFKWKFDIRYDRTRPKKTKEEFLKQVEKKTLNSFIKWEKTSEFRQLLTLYLDSKIANDLEEIYKVVSENAKKGDEKSIKLFLQLQKEISSHAKLALKALDNNDEEEEIEVDDGLEMD